MPFLHHHIHLQCGVCSAVEKVGGVSALPEVVPGVRVSMCL